MLDIFQKTLLKEFNFEGIGLHNGEKSKVRVKPSKGDSGIIFKRTDLNKDNIIHTIFYALLTFFITPYVLVELTGIINTKHFSDPCQMGFNIGFIISLILWNVFTRKNVYQIP